MHTVKRAQEWNGGFLNIYFNNTRFSNPTVFSILSILRHYGAPSPLIDFTRNPFIALYFGAESTVVSNIDNEIDSYFSVYEICPDHILLQHDYKSSCMEFWASTKNYQDQLKEILADSQASEHDEIKRAFHKGFCQKALIDTEAFFIQAKETMNKYYLIQDSTEDTINYYVNTNYNITNQAGLFVICFNETDPLESGLINYFKDLERLDPNLSNKDKKIALKHQIQQFRCYNIHKSLRSYILKKILEKGINKKFVFPDLYSMADDCKNSFLENI